MKAKSALAAIAACLAVAGNGVCGGGAGLQSQVDEIKAVLPKFAISMREVGDRFQNMYHAAAGGNWALAAYMSRYLDKAMNPVRLTKPEQYPDWQVFYAQAFGALNEAIAKEDLAAFEEAYGGAIGACNRCHVRMGYGFIEVKRLAAPADPGIDYRIQSRSADAPE